MLGDASLLDRCSFPPPGTAVTCGLSGGADSLALVVLSVAAGLQVTAVYVDHGLRPESAAEAEQLKEVAARLGVGFEVRQVAVPPGPNLEARARRARYGALPAGVLTGHTADDQAETVLLNLLRGAGLDGLAGMRTQTRPLLALRRAETRALCRKMRLTPIQDPTNDDLAFTRNRIRHQLLPYLAEMSGRDPVPILTRQAQLLADEAAFLDELAAAVEPTDARALSTVHLAVARRVVRRWLRETSGPEHHPPSAAEVERVLAVAAGQVVACELSGHRRVRRSRGRLVLD
ncbi:MAG TPA: tRNA lysidine(34) synthetase TilS [Acidimicrobiales bacterium]|nr:tRNA lysidine(34) synthetase TilS [Acidimicrobiales bacterium]